MVTFEAVKRLKHDKQDGESLMSSDFLIHAHASVFVRLALIKSALF
jgi:hypothetical protein